MNADSTTPPPRATNSQAAAGCATPSPASWRTHAHHAVMPARLDVRRGRRSIRPSRIATMRWAAAAIAASWVTMTIVWPVSLSRRNSSQHVRAAIAVERPGRLVGEQHGGALAIARAIASR